MQTCTGTDYIFLLMQKYTSGYDCHQIDQSASNCQLFIFPQPAPDAIARTVPMMMSVMMLM